MKMDIDKAIAEHTEKFDAMMERHRHLVAKIDKEAAELRQRIDELISNHGETLRTIDWRK
tara:strand:+ start:357 stop:536 length:180 start_codon:yes stop_codon:yes gene_type:complete